MATGNPWYSAAETTLPQYVPLPFQELMAAGQVIQNRYDTNMVAIDSTAQGIASIETRLPGHQQYVADFANRFQEETEELLSRYNNNAADPQFSREFTRLRSRYANDPNLRTILNANAAYDANQEIRKKLMESGKRFIDNTRGVTGLNPDGTLSADVGTIRATNFESDLHNMYQDTLKATINDFRGRISNEEAVGMVTESLLSEGANNPILREAMEYYISQGATPEQAQEQLLKTLQREAYSSLTIDRDGSYYTHNLAERRFNFDQAKFNYDVAKDSGSMMGLVTVNPASIQGLTDMKRVAKRQISQIRESIDPSTGEINATTIENMEDTPENRALLDRFGGYDETWGSDLSRRGTFGNYPGAPNPRVGVQLRPKSAQQGSEMQNAILNEQVEYMRKELGLSPDTPVKDILNEYEKIVDRNSFVPKRIQFTRDATNRAFANTHGTNLSGAVMLNSKGKYERINPDDFDLSTAKDDLRVQGILTTDIPGLEGAGSVTEYTRTINGKQVTYFKPTPSEIIGAMPITLMGSMAQTAGLSNQELYDPNNGFVMSNPEMGVNIAPQVSGAGIKWIMLDPTTGEPLLDSRGGYRFVPSEHLAERENQETRGLSINSDRYK